MDAGAATDERGKSVRRNRLGPTPRCRRQLLKKLALPRGDGVTKSRVTRTISYKPYCHCVGEAGVFTAEPVCSWAAYAFATRLRDRGCSAHPVFPAPSLLKRANEMQ